MQKLSVIGNLGNDAEVRAREDGSKFVTFKVADTSKWTDLKGVVHESTQWISCVLNGDGGKLLQYLKKGVKVYVDGRPSYRVYSSEKERAVKCGVDIAVNSVELCGGSSDDVPRMLVDSDGQAVDVSKHYWTDPSKHKSCFLYGIRGGQFVVDANGFIQPIAEGEQTAAQQEQGQSAEQQVQPQESTQKTNSKKKS